MEPAARSPAVKADAIAPRRGDRTLPIMLLVAAALVGALLAAFRPAADPDAVGPHDATPSTIAASWVPAPQPTGETASLAIDFGNGARREFATLPWTEGMTVADLMEHARRFRPAITYTQQGEGKMAFLSSLEGVANENGNGRYWLYSVDGRHGEVSFGAQTLEAGAAVLWQFRRGE